MSWRDVLDGVDAVESWIAGQSYWVQVPVLLAVLLPIGWALAGLIDRVVEKILAPHTRREMRVAASASIARSREGRATSEESAASASVATYVDTHSSVTSSANASAVDPSDIALRSINPSPDPG